MFFLGRVGDADKVEIGRHIGEIPFNLTTLKLETSAHHLNLDGYTLNEE
jgi:hypothetical protein